MFKSKMLSIFVALSLILFCHHGFGQEVMKKPKTTTKPKKLTKDETAILKSQKAIWIAHVLREKKEDKVLSGLEVVQEKVPVFLVPKGDEFRPLVKLTFKYNGGQEVKLQDATRQLLRFNPATGTYTLYAYLSSHVNSVRITAVPERGERKSETLYIFAPEAREFKSVNLFDSIQFVLGHNQLTYRQTSAAFDEYKAQSLLLGIKYLSPENGKKLGYFADLHATVLAYSAEPIDDSAQFLEGRLGLSYSTKIFKNPRFRSRILFGLRTINLFSLADLGFTGLWGVNVGLKSEFFKSGKNSFAYELEYTPYDFGDPLRERTLKAGLEWNRNLNNIRRMQLGLSYSDNSFTDGLEKIRLGSASLYFGLSF